MTHRKSKHYIPDYYSGINVARALGTKQFACTQISLHQLFISISWFSKKFAKVDIFLRFPVAALVGVRALILELPRTMSLQLLAAQKV